MAIDYIVPTDEKIKECLLNNTLDRSWQVFSFCNLLSCYKEATSIALDGNWGSGKTFFVKQCKLVFDAYNAHSSMGEDDRTNISKAVDKYPFSESIKNSLNYTVYYDAWENDNHTDPLLSLLYCIAVETNTTDALEHPPHLNKLIGDAIDTVSKRNISGFFSDLKCDNPLSEIKAQERLKQSVREYLNELPCERGNRVNIIIDELDRCTPSFAIKLLERTKHYIDDDRITFIFATNIQILEKTVRHYYGESINGTKYLDRFFDVRMLLPPIREGLLFQQISFGSYSTGGLICRYIARRFNLSLRETIRYAGLYRRASKIGYDEKTMNFWKEYLLPLALALELSNMDDFRLFMSGEGKEQIDILFEMPGIKERLIVFFQSIFRLQDNPVEVESLRALVEELYESILKTDFSRKNCVYFRDCHEISSDVKHFAFLSVGLFDK